MVTGKRVVQIVTLVTALCMLSTGCPMQPDDMGLPAQAPVPGEQGPTGAQGQAGAQGPQGPQGPPGVSPFSLMGNDAVYTQGNVGIGTTTPAKALHVVGDTRVDGTLFADAISSNSPLELQTAGTTRIFVDDVTGDTGIGTTTPVTRLHVVGDSRFEGSMSLLAGGLNVQDSNVVLDSSTPFASELRLVNRNAAATDLGFIGFANNTDLKGLIGYNATDDALTFGTNGTGVSVPERMRIDKFGHVGIGTTNPCCTLHVAGFSHFGGPVNVFGKLQNAVGNELPMEVSRAGDGVLVQFKNTPSASGSISQSGFTVSYNAFTGSHYAWANEPMEPGALVSMTGTNRRFRDSQEAEIVYGIRLAARANDPACMGAYGGLLEPSKPPGADNPHLVAAVGNGRMWVVDRGSDIWPGDYLIASRASGCAMRDDPARFPIGYIVARAAEGVRWSEVKSMKGNMKRVKISVFFESFIRNSEANRLAELVETQQREIDALRKRLDDLEKMTSRLTASQLKPAVISRTVSASR